MRNILNRQIKHRPAKIILFISMVVVTVFILVPMQTYINTRLEGFKANVITVIEEALDSTIAYDSISPSIFRFLEIRNLRVYPGNDPEMQVISINKVRVLYNLFPLVFGSPSEALKEIRIENSSFYIDSERDAKLISFITNTLRGSGNGRSSANVHISGRNLYFEYQNKDGQITLAEIFFDLDVGDTQFYIRAQGTGSGRGSNQELPFSSIVSDFSLSGEIGRSFDWSNVNVTVEDVETDLIGIRRLTMNVQMDEQGVKLRKIQDKSPFDISATYNFASRELKGTYISEDFIPSTVFIPSRNVHEYSSWFETRITGESSIRYSVEDSSSEYSGDLELSLPRTVSDFGVNGQIRFEGTEKRVVFSPVNIDTSVGNMNFSGELNFRDLYPAGRLSLRNLRYPREDQPIDADLILQNSGEHLSIYGGARIGEQLLGDILAVITYDLDKADFSASTFVNNPQETITAKGSVYFQDTPGVEVSGSIGAVNLKSLADLLNVGSASFLDDYTLSSEFSFSNVETLQLSIAPASVRGISEAENFAEFSVKGSGSSFALNIAALKYEGVAGNGNVSLSSVRSEQSEFTAGITLNEIDYSLDGMIWDGDKIGFFGNYGLEGLFLLEGSRQFSVRGKQIPLPYSSDGTAYLSLNVGGSLDKDEWEIFADEISIENLPQTGGLLQISAQVTPEDITFPKIVYDDGTGLLEGRGYISTDINELRTSVVSGVSISGADGWFSFNSPSEEVLSYFSMTGNEIESTVIFNGLNLARFPGAQLKGRAVGRSTISGELDDIRAEIELSFQNAEFNGDPLSFDASVVYEDDLVIIENTAVSYLGARLREGTGEFSLAEGAVSFSSVLQVAFRGESAEGELILDGTVFLEEEKLSFSDIAEKDFLVSATISDIELREGEPQSYNMIIQRTAKTLRFQGGAENSISGSVLDDGTFSVVLSAPLPLRFSGEGRLSKGEIEAEFRELYVFVPELESVLAYPIFSIYDGTLYSPSIAISGSVNDPEIYGTLSARNLWATSRFLPELIGPFQADFEIFEKDISATDLLIPVGSSAVTGDLFFGMDHWLPQTFHIALKTMEKRPIRIASKIKKIDFSGQALGSFEITGDNVGVHIDADLVTNNTTVALSNESFEPTRRRSYVISTDINLTTGKGVEFLWPFKNLPILRTYAELGQNIRIQTNSLDQSLSLKGEIEIRGGEIIYFQRNFYIRSGNIVFNEDENSFDPILTARAEIRETGAQGENISIFLIVDEKPFSQFSPRFESVPVYSDVEIAQILGSGALNVAGSGQNDLTSALLTTEGLLEQFVLVRSFENSIKNFLNLDVFSLRTQIIQNALIERTGINENEELPPGSLVGRYLDNTSLIGGKYLLDDLFIQMMLQVKSNDDFFDEYGRNSEAGYYLDAEIDLEWQTPFFLLDMAFFPRRDVLSSLIDTRVGLSWRFSF